MNKLHAETGSSPDHSHLFASFSQSSLTRKILAVLFGLFFLYCALVSAIQIIAFNKGWYHDFYQREKLAQTLDIPEEDLDGAIDILVEYVEGKRDNIDYKAHVDGNEALFYNEKELDHMKDVRALWQRVRLVRDGCLPLLLLLLCYFYYKKAMGVLLAGTLWAYGGFLLVLLLLGLWFVIDFTSLWTAFHQLFFSNDLWLLDPATDRMIWLCPESMFSSLILQIALCFALFSLATGLLLGLGARWTRKKSIV